MVQDITTDLFLFYSAILIYLVFFARRRRHLNIRYLNLVPIKNSLYDYRHIAAIGTFNYYTNLFGNVLLFIPLPFVLDFLFNKTRFSTIMLIGFLLSLGIELLQFIFEAGYADIDDLILNTFGTFIGYFCYKTFEKLIHRTSLF